ncbi:transposase [Polaromonas hydrogenivorans]|uniref:Transposase n=1 Tax=Polaromonas hydrogenivorans TaxID=335476 RepID=A0AAU7LZA3_9BURK
MERRWGARIAARGIYRDPVRSSRSHFVKVSGLRWLCMMLLVPIPWAARVWALPFLTALCPSQRYHDSQGKRHKKLTDWARQMVKQVSRWLPNRPIVIVADSAFAALDFLGAARRHATVITRLRLDAALYAPAPERRPGQRGRTRLKGERLPALGEVLADSATAWTELTLACWYGEHDRTVEVASSTAVWYHPGMPTVPLRWILIRDPLKQFESQALLCTAQEATPSFILECFVQRWQVEVTFEEARAHLGVETQRQWSDKAIARTTPCLFALYSLVTLAAQQLFSTGQIYRRCAAWYPKPQATFSDTIACVRRNLWSHAYFSISPHESDMGKIPRPLVDRFIDSLCYAA